MKGKKLLLIDLENKHKVDLSPLDESFRAIIFVGANQNPPKASKHAAGPDSKPIPIPFALVKQYAQRLSLA